MMTEVFIKSEDIKQEVVDDEVSTFCSVEESFIEMNVNVKEEPFIDPYSFVDIKPEIYDENLELDIKTIKQEDGIHDSEDTSRHEESFIRPKRKRVSECDFPSEVSCKKSCYDLNSAILDHCYYFQDRNSQMTDDPEDPLLRREKRLDFILVVPYTCS